MKRLKISSLYDDIFLLVIPFLLVLYFKSFLLLLLAIIFLFFKNRKMLLMFIILILLILLRLLLNTVDTKIYYLKEIKINSIILSNSLYNIEIYTDEDYHLDDIFYIEDKGTILNQDKFAKNIFYRQDEDSIKLLTRTYSIRSLLFDEFLKLKESELKSFIGSNLFSYNDYSSDFFLDINISLSTLFIYNFLKKTLKRFKRNKYISFLILFIFMGFKYSLIRVFIYDIFNNKRFSKSTAFSLASITLLIIEPYSIHSYAFLIPFLLRLGLLFKSELGFKEIMTIIQSLFFYEINPFTILLYKKIMSFIALLNVISLLSLIIKPLYILNEFLFNILKLFLPILNLSIRGKISIIVILFYYLFIKIFKIKYDIIKWLILILIVFSNISNINTSISFIDVGQGDAILIKSNFNDEVILIDTANSYNYYKLDRFLKSKGIYQIDYLIITHCDADHSANIRNLYLDYDIKEVILEAKDIKGRYFKLMNLNGESYDNSNDNSLVYYLNINNMRFLFTGDISKNVENNIVRNYPTLEIDFLKLSHHGSKTGTSEYLLDSYKVKYAIASTSGQYNHPSFEVINSLDERGIKYLITKYDKDIVIDFYKFWNVLSYGDSEFVIIR